MLDLNKIFELWLKCTGKDVSDFDKIRIGVESDWLCHEAKKHLETDPSGLLSGITIRAAYRKFIKEHQVTIEDLISGEWDKVKNDWAALKHELYEDNIGLIVNDTINSIVTTINNFGRKVSYEDIENEDVEKIFVDAFDKMRHYKVDTFTACNNHISCQPKILNKLFRFEHYQQFVNAMKSHNEDNFIAIGLIDRTFEVARNTYEEKGDKFFAFGVKCNGGVLVVSDRTVQHSPNGSYGHRNPMRDLENKMDYDHLPYYKLKEIYDTTEINEHLLLTSGNEGEKKSEEFCSSFDLEGYIYITAIIAILTNKYFKVADNWKNDIKVFGSELKFLTSAESKSLVTIDDKTVILPENNVMAKDYPNTDKVYNHGLYDFYVPEHPVTDVVPVDRNFVGTTEEIRALAWWNTREAQRKQIEKDLNESHTWERQREIKQIIRDRQEERLEYFLELALTTPDEDRFAKYKLNWYANDHEDTDNRPYLWQEYSKGAILDTLEIRRNQYKSQSDWMSNPRWVPNQKGNIGYEKYDGWIRCWLLDDNKNRSVEIQVIFRSYGDFIRHLGFETIEELPKELRHYLYTRGGPFTGTSWEPYDGNSILEFTDPMSNIKNPWNSESYSIYYSMSKSMYNKLIKKYGNKRSSDLELREEGWYPV